MFLDLIVWLIATSIIGIFSLPIFNRVSNNTNLTGYFISIPLFLVINGLISWLLFLLIENYIVANFISVILLISFSIYELYKNRYLYIKKINMFAVGAILIALFQIIYLIYRSFNPDLIGTEKIMDFMMLSSVYNSSEGIVRDIWFSGSSNPYYYFGYWIYSSLLKLLFIDLYIGYNLLLSITFSLSILVSGAISYNYLGDKIIRINKLIISSFTPLFIVFISNFYILFELFSKLPNTKNILNKLLTIEGYEDSSGFFYGSSWRSTRIINTFIENISKDYAITEYPSFTFLLGDLHPHLISIPFMLLSIFFISSIFTKNFSAKENIKNYFFVGLLIPINGFINIWDAPFLILLMFISIFLVSNKNNYSFNQGIKFFLISILGSFVSLIILSNFYFITLSSQSAFPFINVHQFSSSFHHFLIVIGSLMFLSSIYLKNKLKFSRKSILLTFFGAALLVLNIYFIKFFILGFSQFNLLNFLLNYPVQFLLIILLIFSIFLVNFDKDKYPAFLLLSTLSILLVVENFRIVDLFNNRMNTIFKSYFQVWILMALFIPVVISKININIKNKDKNMLIIFLISIFFISSIQLSSNIYYSTNRFNKEITLNSSNFIENIFPGSSEVIAWIKENTKKEDIIFYEVGSDYNVTSFFSAFTGRSTPIGWPGHQKQWGRDNKEINQRIVDLENPLENLKKYKIKYYIVNNDIKIEKGDLVQVFDNKKFKIYKVE
ncbi:MAG: DUF2298 domain-containing protein [Dehalococcoidia bacterium]|tara:strand:- start:493 stop:2658 length:2166 start_codon:yes stop_codon:yes gene_type:complete